MKKITIHDVAREAGVSAATVSYVINDKKGKTISEETKKKVWQIVNLYNYKPGAFAKNLRSAPNLKLIAVYSGNDTDILYLSEFQYFLSTLRGVFPIAEYTIVLSGLPYRKLDNVDGIICYGVDRKGFFDIANLNYVPVLSVDCDVKDVLFYQVRTDYEKLKALGDDRFKGDYLYLTIPPKDETVLKTITDTFKNVEFIASLEDLYNFSVSAKTMKQRNLLTDSKTLYEFIKRGFPNAEYCDSVLKNKCELLLKMFNLASQTDSSAAVHDYFA